MAHIIVMPQMGYDVREGLLVRWFKREGDEVAQGDEVAEIETDKVVVSVTAAAGGVLRKVLVEEGAMVLVGSAIALVAGAHETIPDDLAQIMKRATSAVAAGGTQRSQLSRMRQAIVRVTSRSMQEVPHFYVTSEVDMTEAVRFRRELNAAQRPAETRVSINDIIIKACALALAKHPTINASFKEEALELHSAINIGIAVDLEERGLIIPNLAGCEARSLVDIAAGSRDLVQRAKEDRLRAEELSGSTFTISNMGTLDVESFTSIIFQPNSAILAVAALQDRPVVRGGEIAVARLMKMTLSVDHRVSDGAAGARFMRDVKRHLEHPAGMTE